MLVADGNFSAEHMHMKHPERDVALADGECYTVKSEPYEDHMRLSDEEHEVYFVIPFLVKFGANTSAV